MRRAGDAAFAVCQPKRQRQRQPQCVEAVWFRLPGSDDWPLADVCRSSCTMATAHPLAGEPAQRSPQERRRQRAHRRTASLQTPSQRANAPVVCAPIIPLIRDEPFLPSQISRKVLCCTAFAKARFSAAQPPGRRNPSRPVECSSLSRGEQVRIARGEGRGEPARQHLGCIKPCRLSA